MAFMGGEQNTANTNALRGPAFFLSRLLIIFTHEATKMGFLIRRVTAIGLGSLMFEVLRWMVITARSYAVGATSTKRYTALLEMQFWSICAATQDNLMIPQVDWGLATRPNRRLMKT